ncbi:uncharacterized protein LOC123398417 [Hordeum vulgare subsp. vulgare]|uniref:uncharacterized protein LOC123398417 n=1 Tax=Hordeum vulgare subsp. vulgare TaxID=112509 RepID=UPI001D1A3D00|nr:uncharacterized protein LOC123398417 [Hordeum vulgare subsp. vulgare]
MSMAMATARTPVRGLGTTGVGDGVPGLDLVGSSRRRVKLRGRGSTSSVLAMAELLWHGRLWRPGGGALAWARRCSGDGDPRCGCRGTGRAASSLARARDEQRERARSRWRRAGRGSAARFRDVGVLAGAIGRVGDVRGELLRLGWRAVEVAMETQSCDSVCSSIQLSI